MLDSLFWALYLIDVISGIGAAFALTLLFMSLAGGFGALWADVTQVTDTTTREFDRKVRTDAAIRWSKRVFPIMFPLMLLVPSKDTMYMMLAVKMGDHAISSETGQKLVRVLNNKIDGYIKQMEGGK